MDPYKGNAKEQTAMTRESCDVNMRYALWHTQC